MPKTLTSKDLTGQTDNSALDAEAAAAEEMMQQARQEQTASDMQEEAGLEEENSYADDYADLANDFEMEDRIEDYTAKKVEEQESNAEETTSETSEETEFQKETAEEEKLAEKAEEPSPAEETVTDESEEAGDDVEIPEVPPEPEKTRSPEEVAEAVKQARETAHQKLMEHYKLTEEQEELLMQEPNKVLPDLAARMYLDLFDSLTRGMQTQMPTLINGVMQMRTAQEKQQKAFFRAWPDLAKAEYVPTIDRIKQQYMLANPNTDMDTAIKEIGAQAWVALRLPLDKLVERTQGKPQIPAPAPKPTNVTHMPANAGSVPSSARQPVQAPSNNPFVQLAEEFLDDDEF